MKKVNLTIVVRNDEDARILAREMENSHIAQSGLYTLNCGSIEECTKQEIEEVESQIEL